LVACPALHPAQLALITQHITAPHPWPPLLLPQHGWEVAGGRITFKPAAAAGKEGGGAAAMPSLELIGHCMNYARELERIV